MNYQNKCPKCGTLVLPEKNICPCCGASLVELKTQPELTEEYESESISEEWNETAEPHTIEEFKAFCPRNGMPLERMRFFLDEDYREPRAFGIYRDGDLFVVYKNKADGSRAERYHGPDERYAVKELYNKLLDECHSRDIWPDGKPETVIRQEKAQEAKKQLFRVISVILLLIFVVFMLIHMHNSRIRHADDGYYAFDDGGIYYRYGYNWYYDDDIYDWILLDSFDRDQDYGDYYLGDSYDSDWGYSDFRESSTWQEIREAQESHTSSEDYDSWDSSDTDWDSDW